ncbi:YqeG family HAD IIIA-type phosphatase [Tepidibacillus marianensis]|uniref:YqeG family HAD IIIA-type phosphatase n=1 Tax=Tepidibacillus marianensis TaxID=3131995 RepID=UPI0030CBB1D3
MFLKYFAPDLYVQSIYHIDLAALKKRGITSVITDLDNTLVEADSPHYTPRLVKWLDDLQEMGFKVIIVSNNNLTRVSEFADPLTVPYVHQARKPAKRAFAIAMERLQSTTDKTVVIGDQLLTDIFGGKRMGLYTILVVPISEKEQLGTKINRAIERRIMKWLKRRGMLSWEDHR